MLPASLLVVGSWLVGMAIHISYPVPWGQEFRHADSKNEASYQSDPRDHLPHSPSLESGSRDDAPQAHDCHHESHEKECHKDSDIVHLHHDLLGCARNAGNELAELLEKDHHGVRVWNHRADQSNHDEKNCGIHPEAVTEIHFALTGLPVSIRCFLEVVEDGILPHDLQVCLLSTPAWRPI